MPENKELNKDKLDKVTGGMTLEDFNSGESDEVIIGQGTDAGGAIYNDGTGKEDVGPTIIGATVK